MSPKNFGNIYHPEQEISPYWPIFSKFVSRKMDWQTYKKILKIQKKCTNISGMCPQNVRDISHQEQEISLYLSNFSKEVSQTTDWQTCNNFRIICKKSKNILGMSPKNFRKISHSELEICLDMSNFSKEVSQLTDRQTHKKFRIIWI